MFARIINCCIGILSLVVTLPVSILIAAAIWLQDGSPVLFMSERIGFEGRRFRLYKFRTMRPDAEVVQVDCLRTDVPRQEEEQITNLGRILRRFHLDELPQFINLALGDLNLVGPRPERAFAARARSELVPGYERRLSVRPGITGWAQIHYPYKDASEKLSLDLYYIENRSFLLDVEIVLRTLLRMAAPLAQERAAR